MTKAEIAFVRSLSDKKERLAHGLFVAEGGKLVDEMVRSGLAVRKIYRCGREPEGLAGFRGDMESVSPKEMERISTLKTPAAVLALVEIPHHTFDPASAARDLLLALDNVQDPGNMGTIIRLADWFGIRDIVCSETSADCFNPKVVQATMGALARVRVHYTDLSACLGKAAAAGISRYGTFLDGENIYRAALSANGYIVMGSEGKGISPDIEKLVSHRLHIPSFAANDLPSAAPSPESLNVAVATAVVCSEFRRRE